MDETVSECATGDERGDGLRLFVDTEDFIVGGHQMGDGPHPRPHHPPTPRQAARPRTVSAHTAEVSQKHPRSADEADRPRPPRSPQARPRGSEPARPRLRQRCWSTQRTRTTSSAASTIPPIRRAGLHRIRFHDLRHTFVTYCAAAGVPQEQVRDWIGHTDTRTTEIYRATSQGAESTLSVCLTASTTSDIGRVDARRA